jgi:hypothetical protein
MHNPMIYNSIMPNPLTTAKFIEKAQKIHGNMFSYILAAYNGSKTKVKIMCSKHGMFEQTPNNHLRGAGCPLCAGDKISKSKSKGAKSFIEQAIFIHGDNYDYTNVIYKNNRTPVEIICSIHGSFFQAPTPHLAGSGCFKCGILKTAAKRSSNTEEFIQKSIKTHGNTYDYVLSVYNGAINNVIIICKIHGAFSQTPNSHLNGAGCNRCADERARKRLMFSTEKFIELAHKIHGNKYDYTYVIYNGMYKNIQIICPDHGAFYQKPVNHIKKENGCQKCSKIVSKPEIEWLDYLQVPEKYRQARIVIGGKLFKLDAYNPEINTIYEFYGDFWHGNPKIYNSEDENPVCKRTFGKLYNKTIQKEKALDAAGYNLITIWENDWKSLCKIT